MNKSLLTFVLLGCTTAALAESVDKLTEQDGKLKISGYIQAQAQWRLLRNAPLKGSCIFLGVFCVFERLGEP